MILSNVFERIHKAYFDDKKFFIINYGGTSSTKTYSILQFLVSLALYQYRQIDCVGLSVPHLKTGLLNDMPRVCNDFGINFFDNFNKSDKVFRIGKGVINFLSFDNLGKAHGGRRDVLYLNEANHLNFNIVEQLIARTRKAVFIDFNPTNRFWVHDKLLIEQPEKCVEIKSTYKDNPCLEQSIIDYIESKRGNNNFWRVYGLGELGIAEGLVFNNFELKEFDKTSFNTYRYGIDWGFSQDPFAFVEMAIHKNCLYICNEIQQKGLLNKDSAMLVKPIAGTNRIICDSSEPKSIQEFISFNLNAIGAKKGKGSVESGIKFIQSFEKVYIHPSCKNTYDEFCNYQWRQDKNGDYLPEPMDAFNHSIDAIRYALEDEMHFNASKIVGRRLF